MSEFTHEPEHHNRWVYWGAWILLIGFMVIGLFTFSSANESRQANEKADELISALEDAGATSLPTEGPDRPGARRRRRRHLRRPRRARCARRRCTR